MCQWHITLEVKQMNDLQVDNIKCTVSGHSPLKSTVTMKCWLAVTQKHRDYEMLVSGHSKAPWLAVTQNHWKRQQSMDCIRLHIHILSNFGTSLYCFWDTDIAANSQLSTLFCAPLHRNNTTMWQTDRQTDRQTDLVWKFVELTPRHDIKEWSGTRML